MILSDESQYTTYRSIKEIANLHVSSRPLCIATVLTCAVANRSYSVASLVRGRDDDHGVTVNGKFEVGTYTAVYRGRRVSVS